MNIFVGCSSMDTLNQDYNKLATDVGNFIVNNNHTLVFGGCEYGLMGKVYSVVSKNSNNIIVTTAKAYEEDSKKLTYSKLLLFDTVNERKNGYTSISDLIIFIPGGIGTIDEILTAIETRRNHEHNTPIVIINVNNYFDPLLKMLEKTYSEGFANPKVRALYFVANSFKEAEAYINNINQGSKN